MATTNADTYRGTGSANTTTESKEDALTGMEFERLFQTTYSMDEYDGIRSRFAALVLGRLGLRRAELTHLKESWVDFHEEMIAIPRQQTCRDGRGGDKPCGTCYQSARQTAARDDVDQTVEEIVADYWNPKSDAAVREVYFGFSPRVRFCVREFIDRFGGWCWSGTTINRRVNTMTARADGLSQDQVRPHSLRATAATFHAARGLDIYGLMQMFGWVKFSTAEKYISRNALATARKMDSMSMG